MSVGIYDQDSIIYTHAPLNLEVMKISAYWKSQKQVVKLATDFCPQKYGSFYYILGIIFLVFRIERNYGIHYNSTSTYKRK